MKIKLDKEYTEPEYVAQVKDDMKEFKERYTDGDLKCAFESTFDYHQNMWGAEIISCNVTAFPGGSNFGNVTHFCVEMLVKDFRVFTEIRFYCNLDLWIDEREGIHNIDRYVLEGKRD